MKNNGIKTIVSIYANPQRSSACTVGAVLFEGREIIAIRAITPQGYDDGISVRLRTQVFRTEYDGLYERKMAFLLKKQPVIRMSVHTAFPKTRSYDSLVTWLSMAMDYNYPVSIWMFDEADDTYATGFISAMRGNIVTIKKMDDFGHSDGYINLSIRKIEAIDINGKNERDLACLYTNQSQIYNLPAKRSLDIVIRKRQA
jgi:hypothetical protein